MIRLYSRAIRALVPLLCGVLVLCAAPGGLNAQDSLSVTVTPPLFQLSIGPGESWSSSLKIVNNNAYDVTYYAHVVNFMAKGEEGQSSFTPIVNEVSTPASNSFSLASWIEMATTSVRVKRGDSAELGFSVHVPQNAEAGGHYAAILVGTEPGGLNQAGAQMRVSSLVSSLLFVKIKGNVIEKGRIREFRSTKFLYETPKADFILRFENTGTSHLRPQGDITLYNMWGKLRGKVEINQDGNFGNVLPKSIRKFEFSWEGEDGVFDIGRYSAVVTLAYGEDGKQNITAVTYFWVIPMVPVAIALGSIVLFLFLITWLIRRYIRRALTLERARFGVPNAAAHTPPQPATATIETLIQPLREGVIDLRAISRSHAPVRTPVVQQSTQTPQNMNEASTSAPRARLTPTAFMRKYRLFFLFVFVIISAVISLWWYSEKVLLAEKSYKIHDVKIQEETTSPSQTN